MPNVRGEAGPTDGAAERRIPLAVERPRLLGLASTEGLGGVRASGPKLNSDIARRRGTVLLRAKTDRLCSGSAAALALPGTRHGAPLNLEALSKKTFSHSSTRVACNKIAGGIITFRRSAVFRLITKSNRVGSEIGMSSGLAFRKIFAT